MIAPKTFAMLALALFSQWQLAPAQAKIDDAKLRITYPTNFVKIREEGIQAFKQKKFKLAETQFTNAVGIIAGTEKYNEQQVELMLNIAQVYEKSGQIDRAIVQLQKTIKFVRSHFGQSSGKLPVILDRLARLDPDPQHKHDLLTESLNIRENLVGTSDLSLLFALQRLHSVYVGTAKGLPLSLRIYALRSKTPSFRSNSNSITYVLNLAQEYVAAGQVDKSIKFFKESAELSDHFYSKQDFHHIWTRVCLGAGYDLLGKKEEAEREYNDVFEMAKKWEISTQLERQLITWAGLAYLLKNKLYSPAARLCEVAVNRAWNIPEKPGPDILDVETTAIVSFAKSGDLKKAAAMLARYRSDLKKFYPDEKQRRKIFAILEKQLKSEGFGALLAP